MVRVDHIYFMSEQRDKIKLIEKISRLKNVKALVFVKDIGNLTVIAEKLHFKQIKVSTLHSDLNKMDRQKSIKEFREGKTPMLIATDVAARGLDIQGITHVVHYDFSKDMKSVCTSLRKNRKIRGKRNGDFFNNGTRRKRTQTIRK